MKEVKFYIEEHVSTQLQKGYQYTDDSNGLLKVPQKQAGSEVNSYRRKAENPISNQEDIKRMKINQPMLRQDREETLQKIKEQEKMQAEVGKIIQKEITFKTAPDRFLSRIEQKAQDFDIWFDQSEKFIFAVGPSKNIEKFEKFFHSLFSEDEKEDKGDFLQIQLPFPEILKSHKDKILTKADALELILEYNSDNIVIAGFKSRIKEFKKFLKKKEIQYEIQNFDPSVQPSGLKRESSVMEVSQKIILSTNGVKHQKNIEKRGQELGLKFTLKDKEMNVVGEIKQFKELGAFIFNIDQKCAEQNKSAFLTKLVTISDNLKIQFEGIGQKAMALGLSCYLDGTQLYTAGEEGIMSEFYLWLQDKEYKKTSVIKIENSKNSAEKIQKELNISTFHRAKKTDIEKKAEELELIIEFGYDTIFSSGQEKNINNFIQYLYNVEADGKKLLYPKYWYLYELERFFITDISIENEEFKEVVHDFQKTMPNAQMVKIQRIQNRYLMDHYINLIQKRQEHHPDDPVRRLMLYHGTRQTDPKQIFEIFDTGFDLQYAGQGISGQGIYFALNAGYSHRYAHHVNEKQGHYQMLVADVFIGRPYDHDGGDFRFIKAPKGYDCVHVVNQGFYILYNNFHCYPLYLLEYKIQNNMEYDNMLQGLPVNPVGNVIYDNVLPGLPANPVEIYGSWAGQNDSFGNMLPGVPMHNNLGNTLFGNKQAHNNSNNDRRNNNNGGSLLNTPPLYFNNGNTYKNQQDFNCDEIASLDMS